MKQNRDKTDFAKYRLLKNRFLAIIYFVQAGMAELADALDLGSSVPDVQVQVLLPAWNEPLRMLVNQAFLGVFMIVVKKNGAEMGQNYKIFARLSCASSFCFSFSTTCK